MKPDNWIDGLIWKDKEGKFWKIYYRWIEGFEDYPYNRHPIKSNDVDWYDKNLDGFELTDLTEEEAKFIEAL